MAIRMKVLFLLAIIAASCAQSTDPNAPEDTLPDESTTGPIDPITESPPQTEEIAPAGGGPIESPPAGGETTDPSPIDDEVTGFPIDPIPIEETSEPIPEDPFSQPSETTGDPDTTGPTEPPPDSSTDAPVLSQRSFLRRPLPAEPAPTEPTPSDPQPGPESCGSNEIFETYPLLCNPDDTTCDMYFRGEQRICIPGNFCRPRCRCLPGFVRNRMGVCVMPPQCCDDPNSEMIAGPNTCPGGTCSCPIFRQCDNSWVPFGCQCRPGFLKISEDNPLCVPIETCHLYVSN